MRDSLPWWIWLVPAGFLVIATAAMPYGYYTLTRLIVCVAAAIVAFRSWEARFNAQAQAAVFAVVAVLFNPLIPVFLKRDTWLPIDLVTAAIFVAYALWTRRAAAKAPL